MLGARNSSQVDEFFTRGRHESLAVYFINRSCFGLPKRKTRNNSDRIFLFKQTLRDVESFYENIKGYDMKHDEITEMCHKAWCEKFNFIYIYIYIYIYIDMARNKK